MKAALERLGKYPARREHAALLYALCRAHDYRAFFYMRPCLRKDPPHAVGGYDAHYDVRAFNRGLDAGYGSYLLREGNAGQEHLVYAPSGDRLPDLFLPGP